MTRAGSPKRAALSELGVDPVSGDLKEPESLRQACRGADTLISTATASTSRRAGDSLETVDRDGHLALIEMARREGVRRFVYVSVEPKLRETYFVRIKRQVEAAVRASGMEWAIVQPSCFMEIWLSPLLGWDFANATVRIVGKGDKPVSFISIGDVAAFVVLSALHRATTGRDLPIGGPEAVSLLEVRRICEEITNKRFRARHLPIGLLRLMAALVRPFSRVQSELMMLGVATAKEGNPVDMTAMLQEFPMKMTSIRDYVARVCVQGG